MSGLLRSELVKQRTARTILQLPLWIVGSSRSLWCSMSSGSPFTTSQSARTSPRPTVTIASAASAHKRLTSAMATTDSSARAADHEPGRLAVLVRFSTAANSRFRVPYGWYTDRRGVSRRITS